MNAFEALISAIEDVNPVDIKIFAPRFGTGFLWKIVDEISLYRRKSLDNFTVFIDRFNPDANIEFSLSECIEIIELFPKINLYFFSKNKVNILNSLQSGLIQISGNYEKSYSFESDFSYEGFSIDKVLISITNEKATQRFQDIKNDSICINRKNTEQIRDIIQREGSEKTYTPSTNYTPLAFSLSFLSRRTNQIHNAGAGLNWGQPTSTRTRKDLNAAYIAVPTSLLKSESLPQSNQNFTCKFEDGVEIDMIRTGSGGKNLTSSYDNQIFGRYIRHKLGIAPGKIITQADLTKASITGMNFYKLNENSYLVQFKQ